MNKVISGRADRVIYNPKTGVVLIQDFKTGWSPPEDPIEQNAQLKVLAVVAALHLRKIGVTVRTVHVEIISGPYGIFQATYELADLARAFDEILSTLKAIHDPIAPLNPSVEACRYCPAAMICQPCRALLSPPTKFQTTTLPLEPDRAAKMLDEIEILEGVFAEVKKFYSQRLESDPEFRITHYAMVPGAIRREVPSENWQAVRQRLGEWLDLSEIEAASNYRLGDLERALGKKLSLRGKELKERMGQILDGLIEEKQNLASLRRISGKPKLVTVELP